MKENFQILRGDLIQTRIKKVGRFGFGLALTGLRDRNRMGTFVCGIRSELREECPLKVGDELLKVHQSVVRGRSHLNVSAVFKKLPTDLQDIHIIALRNETNYEKMAVENVNYFPEPLDDVVRAIN